MRFPLASVPLLPFLALVFAASAACTSSTASPSPGSVAENGDCNADADCAKVAGKELTCICAPSGGAHAQCTASLAAGASCFTSSQFQTPCATGFYCEATVTPNATTGAVCTAYLARGADCSSGVCGSGLACGTDHTCGDLLAIGSACLQDRECVTSAVCASFVCAAPAAVGQSCFGSTPSASDTSGARNPCVSGAACVSGTCAVPKANGASCNLSDECASQLCVHNAAAGTCAAESGSSGSEQLCAR